MLSLRKDVKVGFLVFLVVLIVFAAYLALARVASDQPNNIQSTGALQHTPWNTIEVSQEMPTTKSSSSMLLLSGDLIEGVEIIGGRVTVTLSRNGQNFTYAFTVGADKKLAVVTPQ